MFYKQKKIFIISILSFIALSILGYFSYEDYQYHHIETIWGEKIECTDDVLKVIDCPIVQRLKYIDQSGPARYFGPKIPSFSRYEHSIGVFALLKKFNITFKEQIAGLLHDASHTVFSHVGDFIWADNINDYSESSFQDTIHLKYLRKYGCEKTLKEIGLNLKDVDIEHNDYSALDQNLPDMCADRIQYNIHTGILISRISKKEANDIVNSLAFKNNKWFFEDINQAKKFAELSLYFTQNFWGSKWNTSMNIHFANALKRALKLKILTLKDMFSTDKSVVNKLIKNQDRIIQLNLQQCKQPIMHIQGQKYKKQKFYPKFRGIDPLIIDQKGNLKRLSEVDIMFKNHYNEVKSWCKTGFDMDILVE